MSRQAHSIDQLVIEVNEHAPKRSKASDGGKASPAHHLQNPTSDHEPNEDGVWTAYDFTSDPTHGLSGTDLATRLAKFLGKHPAMMAGAYVIWNRRIISFNRLSEGWRNYPDGDPHTSHVHLSVSDAANGYDSRQPWNLWAPAPTRITTARGLLTLAAAHAGPIRRRAIQAALKLLPKR